MKSLFKSKPRGPVELAHQLRELLFFVDPNSETREKKRQEKLHYLSKRIWEIKILLYGPVDGSEPNPEACANFTQEFFKDDTFRLLITSLPKLDSGFRQDAIHVLTNLQRQRINSRIIASEYMENNMDIMDILVPGYEDTDIALTYGAISRACIRHQSVAKYVLDSNHFKKFFDYVQTPSFEVASDAAATFKELLTRHKSTAAEFLSENYDWFFKEYNSRLLLSESYITRRHSVQLLGDILLDRSNSAVMLRYVSSFDNMKILMNLLREPNKAIQMASFHVFKLFVANQNKPDDINNVLVTNKSKLIRFFEDFNVSTKGKDKAVNEQFEADKAQVVREINSLEPRDLLLKALEKRHV